MSQTKLALKCENFSRRFAQVEIAGKAFHSFDAFHGLYDLAELIAERDAAKRDPVICREHLNSAAVLNRLIQLSRYSRGEQVIGSWSESSFGSR
jgi:hypothetical protein